MLPAFFVFWKRALSAVYRERCGDMLVTFAAVSTEWSC